MYPPSSFSRTNWGSSGYLHPVLPQTLEETPPPVSDSVPIMCFLEVRYGQINLNFNLLKLVLFTILTSKKHRHTRPVHPRVSQFGVFLSSGFPLWASALDKSKLPMRMRTAPLPLPKLHGVYTGTDLFFHSEYLF